MKTLLWLLTCALLPLSVLAGEPNSVEWKGGSFRLTSFSVHPVDLDTIVLNTGDAQVTIPWNEAPKAVQKWLKAQRDGGVVQTGKKEDGSGQPAGSGQK